jgi:hypothetical protein
MTNIFVALSQAFVNKPDDPKKSDLGFNWITTDASLSDFVAHIQAGKAFAVGTYQNNHRKEINFIQSQIVALDLDSTSMQVAQQNPDIAKYALILHETPSHTTELPKARVIFILDKPIPRLESWRKAQAAVLHHFTDLKPDTSCHDGARFFYGSTKEYIIQAGNRLPVDTTVYEWVKEHEAHEAKQLEVGPGSTQNNNQDNASKYADKAYQDELAELKATTDHRNNKLFQVTCNLLAMARGAWPGISEERVLSDCNQVGIEIGLTQKEVTATIASAEKKATGRPLILSEKPAPRLPDLPQQPNPPTAKAQSPVITNTNAIRLSTHKILEQREKFHAMCIEPNLVPGFKTDIHLFNLLTGGFQRGYVHSVVGETGSMKTQLCMGFAYAAMQQTPVLIISMESSTAQIINRLVAYGAKCDGVAFSDLNKGRKIRHLPDNGGIKVEEFTPNDMRQILNAYSTLEKLQDNGRLHIPENIGMTPLETLYGHIGSWVEKHEIGFIIWDGFGDMIIPGLSVADRTTITMTWIEKIAHDFNVAIVGTSQGGRNTKNRINKVLGIHDGYGGSAVEGKSAIHMSLYDPWALLQQGLIERSDIDEVKVPQGHAILRLNKIREGALSNNSIPVMKFGGAGFYEVKGKG